jgi:hypothetical protein
VEKLTCARCGIERDTRDNFCRSCGHQFTVNLPAIRESGLPVRQARPAVPRSLVGSVAVLAVGTGIEWLARRMAGSAARAAGRAIVSANPLQPTRRARDTGTVTIDEVVYVRKIEVRR